MAGRYVLLSIVLLLPALALSSARAGEIMPHKTPVRDVESSVAGTIAHDQDTAALVTGAENINVLHDFFHFAGVQTMTGSIKLDPDSTMIDNTSLPPLAYRITDRLSFGAILNVMHGSLNNKEALREQYSESDRILTLNTSDRGFGVDLGVFYELSTGTRLGVSYLSEVELQINDIPQTNNLTPLPSGALPATEMLDPNLAFKITMPQRVMMGGYHELDDHWAIMGNLGWQDWSSINRLGMEVNQEPPSLNMAAVRNYEDTWHVALGCQYKLNYDVQLTGSAAYDSSMVKKENRTADAAIGDAYRFSFGGQYNWKEILNLGLGYTFVWSGDHKHDQSEPLRNTNLSNEDKSSLHIMGANVSLKF